MRVRLALIVAPLLQLTAAADPASAPAPPGVVPGYSAGVMACRILSEEGPTRVECKGNELTDKSLRELSILRNTIFARYGWAGFRKPWLREHFAKQPWYRPDPRFSYQRLTDADKKNAHFIGVYEHSITERELFRREAELRARHGKIWSDQLKWRTRGGKEVRACVSPAAAESAEEFDRESWDCQFGKQPWYAPNPKYSDDLLTADDRIELGLISRALGNFALDEEQRGKAADRSLDRILPTADLRKLSLRDLRILRNTLYARRGRPFKSPVLRDHFSGMSWYKVDSAYSDRRLSKNDRRNIALIKSVENEFGGPLADEDWLIEPATDGA